jgi:hypothetical protein
MTDLSFRSCLFLEILARFEHVSPAHVAHDLGISLAVQNGAQNELALAAAAAGTKCVVILQRALHLRVGPGRGRLVAVTVATGALASLTTLGPLVALHAITALHSATGLVPASTRSLSGAAAVCTLIRFASGARSQASTGTQTAARRRRCAFEARRDAPARRRLGRRTLVAPATQTTTRATTISHGTLD